MTVETLSYAIDDQDRLIRVDDDWVEVEEVAKRLELFHRGRMPLLDHGICPRCSGQLLAA
jgi:hypothetical protein